MCPIVVQEASASLAAPLIQRVLEASHIDIFKLTWQNVLICTALRKHELCFLGAVCVFVCIGRNWFKQ